MRSHRLIFHIVEAAADKEERTVNILRVLCGAQPLSQDLQAKGEDEAHA